MVLISASYKIKSHQFISGLFKPRDNLTVMFSNYCSQITFYSRFLYPIIHFISHIPFMSSYSNTMVLISASYKINSHQFISGLFKPRDNLTVMFSNHCSQINFYSRFLYPIIHFISHIPFMSSYSNSMVLISASFKINSHQFISGLFKPRDNLTVMCSNHCS